MSSRTRTLPALLAVLIAPSLALAAPPDAVTLDLSPVPRAAAAPDTTTWLATYTKGGHTARVRIRLTIANPATVTFTRAENSNPTQLLPDLAAALRGRIPVPRPPKLQKLTCEAVILGKDLSRDPDTRSFKPKPAGPWIAAKVFVAGGQGEFYLNINTHARKAEFLLKAPEYGDTVLRELARIL